MTGNLIDHGAARAIVEGRHGDPFAHLGLHDRCGWGVTALVPGAEKLWVVSDKTVQADPVSGAEGLFVAALDGPVPYRLRAEAGGFDVGERGRAVDVRLARAEQVEIGTVDDKNFAHAGHAPRCVWKCRSRDLKRHSSATATDRFASTRLCVRQSHSSLVRAALRGSRARPCRAPAPSG